MIKNFQNTPLIFGIFYSLKTFMKFFLMGIALFACAPESSQVRSASGLGARSAHAFTVAAPDTAAQDHLLTGVAGADADHHPQAAAAGRAALDGLIAGAALELSPAGEPDRYGRVPVRAHTAQVGDLAAALVETGWAMVWPRAGQVADFNALYEAEAAARARGAGAWGEGVFQILDPDPDRLAQRLDGPVIVQGRIISTGEDRNGRLYLNFGLNWRSDFTLSAVRDVREAFTEADVELAGLDGAVVRARGWLYAENGPMIALSHPAQLEIIDAPQATAPPR